VYGGAGRSVENGGWGLSAADERFAMIHPDSGGGGAGGGGGEAEGGGEQDGGGPDFAVHDEFPFEWFVSSGVLSGRPEGR
jgi:hypothetical protein